MAMADPRPLPDRTGHGRRHPIYPGWVQHGAERQYTSIFFDTGSTTCWISESAARRLGHSSTTPTTLCGVGGRGPRVLYDAVIDLFFDLHAPAAEAIQIVAGVVPDGHFPGELTIGESVHHDLGWTALPGRKIQLRALKGQPIIAGTDSPVFNAHESLIPSATGLPEVTITGHVPQRGQPQHRVHRAYPRPRTTHSVLKSGPVQTHTDPTVQQLPPLPALTPAESAMRDKFTKLLRDEFPDVFKRSGDMRLSKTKVKHKINTGDSDPIRIPPRRYSPAQIEALKDFVKMAVDLGIIRPSKSPWSAPALLTPKAVRSLTGMIIYRFCVDYRALNKVTKKHAFPLPNVEDEIQRAGGHTWWCTFDLENGFWHVLVDEDDIEKTAFSTPFGQYEWLVMPFGLTNSPATFQMLMNEVLNGIENISTLLDDITAYGASMEAVYETSRRILQRLSEYGLVLNVKKCHFFERRIRFLGFIIDKDGVHSDPAKVSAILARPAPSTATEVRSFLNAVGYFRHFIKDFAKIALSLYSLTGAQNGKSQQITLTGEQKRAWTLLRNALVTTPVLKMFDWKKPVIIESDSSDHHIGAVLLQPWPTTSCDPSAPATVLHPVAYYSHKLNETQQRYAAQERELLAIVNSMQHWSHWIEGNDITVITDHESLKTLDTKTEQPRRILRFIDAIQHYSAHILYRAGKLNVVADWLSRPNTAFLVVHLSDERGDGDSTDPQSVMHLSQMDLDSISRALADDEWPDRLAAFKEQFMRRNGNLHFVSDSLRLLQVLRYDDLMKAAKEQHTARGHCTVGVLQRHLVEQYWHPQMLLATHEATRTCPQCQIMANPPERTEAVEPIAPAQPLQRWGMDHTGPVMGMLLFTLVDYATGWGEAEWAIKADQDETITTCDRIFDRYGNPREIVHDNGGAFVGTRFANFCIKRKIERHNTSPNHPRTNGRSERFNGQVKHLIKRINRDEPTLSRETVLQRALAQYNQAKGIHGHSPYYLLYGTEPSTRFDTSLLTASYVREPTEQEEADCEADLIRRAGARNKVRGDLASAKAQAMQIRAKLQERKAMIHTYGTGDWVLRVRAVRNKHEPKFDGPWQIQAMHAGNTYTLAAPSGKPLKTRYSGTLLYPAYVSDGQPIRSLWYGTESLLKADRQRLAAEAASLEAATRG